VGRQLQGRWENYGPTREDVIDDALSPESDGLKLSSLVGRLNAEALRQPPHLFPISGHNRDVVLRS
jgi:hypothetical protein